MDMFGFLFGLALLWCMLWIGFKLTGAIFLACIWLFVEVPLALAAFGVGLACCCTIILIPIGFWMFKFGLRMLIPGI